jgi:hypothetical protein
MASTQSTSPHAGAEHHDEAFGHTASGRLVGLAPGIAVASIWVVVALAGIFAPELVTGTDPTRIPLAALVAPIAGLVATGFVALHLTTSHR